MIYFKNNFNVSFLLDCTYMYIQRINKNKKLMLKIKLKMNTIHCIKLTNFNVTMKNLNLKISTELAEYKQTDIAINQDG